MNEVVLVKECPIVELQCDIGDNHTCEVELHCDIDENHTYEVVLQAAGPKGDDYVITEQDYEDIATIAKNKIDLSEYAKTSQIPTLTSQLTNDSYFIEDAVYVHTDNNYTNADKAKLKNLDISALEEEIASKVDKVTGKGLSTNDYSTADKSKLAGIEDNANYYVLPDSVVEDASYVHTDNNYTTGEKTKLSTLTNYDDSELRGELSDEVTNRGNADNALSDAIASEALSREAGDTELSGAIAAEALSRETGDTELSNSISEEAKAREVADTKLQDSKVDKVDNKSLVPDTEITKLSGVSTGANKVEASSNNGNIKIDGADTIVYTLPSDIVAVSANTAGQSVNYISSITIGNAGYKILSDYADITNKPSINNITLEGNKTGQELGLEGAIVNNNGVVDIVYGDEPGTYQTLADVVSTKQNQLLVNPSSTTATLTGLTIDGTSYKIAGGSGGGNVDDVYQNGESVLGEDKIARVTVPTDDDISNWNSKLGASEHKANEIPLTFTDASGNVTTVWVHSSNN